MNHESHSVTGHRSHHITTSGHHTSHKKCRVKRKKQRRQQQHWTCPPPSSTTNCLFLHLASFLTTKECRSSDVFSLSTPLQIQNITLTFALPPNFFTEHFINHHHSGHHSHAPTTRRCRVLWIVSRSCEVMRRAVATCRLFFLLRRGTTVERGSTTSR